MSTSKNSFVEAIHDAHADLLRDLQDAEKTVGTGAQPAQVVGCLEKLRTHLIDHFRFEEEGGYMAPVLKEEPRLAPQIQELLAEHAQMAQTLDALIQEIRKSRSVEASTRDKMRAWIGQVRHHETRENGLVQEAYYSSGATGD